MRERGPGLSKGLRWAGCRRGRCSLLPPLNVHPGCILPPRAYILVFSLHLGVGDEEMLRHSSIATSLFRGVTGGEQAWHREMGGSGAHRAPGTRGQRPCVCACVRGT